MPAEPFQVEDPRDLVREKDPRDLAREKNLTWIQKYFQSAFASIFVTGLVIGLMIGLFIIGGGSAKKSAESSKKVSIVAHRGAMLQTPENTEEAILLALNQGADAVQFEIRMSKDKKLFLHADDALVRRAVPECPDELCKDGHKSEKKLEQEDYDKMLNSKVEELSYADFIKYVNVAFDKDGDKVLFDPQTTGVEKVEKAHPPLLSEVMKHVVQHGKVAYCQLKRGESADVLKAVAEFVKNKPYVKHLWFTSFDVDVLKELRKELPAYRYMLLMCTRWDKDHPRTGGEDFCDVLKARSAFKKAKEHEMDGLGMDAWLGWSITQELAEWTRKAREKKEKPSRLLAWTWRQGIPDRDGGDSVEILKAMGDLGLDAFQSSLPPDVREWMKH